MRIGRLNRSRTQQQPVGVGHSTARRFLTWCGRGRFAARAGGRAAVEPHELPESNSAEFRELKPGQEE
jgi:hypothetical protein